MTMPSLRYINVLVAVSFKTTTGTKSCPKSSRFNSAYFPVTRDPNKQIKFHQNPKKKCSKQDSLLLTFK